MRRYSPGSWLGLVTEDGVAVLPGDIAPDLLEQIWESLKAGKGLGALLGALTGAFGTSLAAIPDFAIVTLVGSEARIAVRGPLRVAIEGDADNGTLVVSGARVTTWSESVSESPASIEIFAGATVEAFDPRQLPIGNGVVLCQSVRLALRQTNVDQLVLDTLDPGPTALPALADIIMPEPEPEIVRPERPLRPAAEVQARVIPAAPEPSDHPAAGEDIPVNEQTMGLAYDSLWGKSAVVPAEPVVTAASLIDGVPRFATTMAIENETDQDRAARADDDHDGETLSIEQIRALGLVGPSAPAPLPSPAAPAIPGSLRLSIGGEVLLDRGAVIGRKPSASRFTADRMPHLITVPSPQQDISRSHLEIRCEGMHVFAIDLNTTNGTRLLRAGSDPVRLDSGEQAMLVDGDILDLGDDVTVTFAEHR